LFNRYGVAVREDENVPLMGGRDDCSMTRMFMPPNCAFKMVNFMFCIIYHQKISKPHYLEKILSSTGHSALAACGSSLGVHDQH
jgi:hypothetical protein